jgi:hypothetical protein
MPLVRLYPKKVPLVCSVADRMANFLRRVEASTCRSAPFDAQQLWGTLSGIQTGSLGAGSVGVGLGTTTGLGIVSGISIGSEPG